MPVLAVTAALYAALAVTGGCTRDRGASSPSHAARDDAGKTVTLPSPARRVVSLTPGTTEILFAVGAGASVAGVTSLCDYPPEANSRPKVGDMLSPDLERIVALHPDLVIMSDEGNSRQTYDRLRELGLSVFVSHPRTLNGMLASIVSIGALVGCTPRAVHLRDSLTAMLPDTLPAATRRSSVVLLISLDPLIVAGSGTFIDELIRRAGGENAGAVRIAASTGAPYPTLSREAMLVRDPDVLLVSSDLHVDRQGLLAAFPEWKSLAAMRRGRVVTVDADLFLRPGPRLFQGLRVLRDLIASQ